MAITGKIDKVPAIPIFEVLTASAGQTDFAFTFPVLSPNDVTDVANGRTDLLVFVKDAGTGVITERFKGTGSADFSVIVHRLNDPEDDTDAPPFDGGGTIRFVTGLSVGDKVLLLRAQPEERQTVYATSQLTTEMLENDHDSIMLTVQQALDRADRALKLSPWSARDWDGNVNWTSFVRDPIGQVLVEDALVTGTQYVLEAQSGGGFKLVANAGGGGGGGAPLAHASTHIDGGSDVIDGDKLQVSWSGQVNYSPSASPSEVDGTDQLTAHLKGIDDALAGFDSTLYVRKDGTVAMTGNLDFNGNNVIDMQEIQMRVAGTSRITNLDELENNGRILNLDAQLVWKSNALTSAWRLEGTGLYSGNFTFNTDTGAFNMAFGGAPDPVWNFSASAKIGGVEGIYGFWEFQGTAPTQDISFRYLYMDPTSRRLMWLPRSDDSLGASALEVLTQAQHSIALSGGKLQLVNDAASPGADQVYGTDGAGVKGWKADPAGGSGDSVSVNASAATDADFDDALPAPPAGDLNVKWQITGASPSDISAYVDVSALEPLVNHDNLSGFVANEHIDWTTPQATKVDPGNVRRYVHIQVESFATALTTGDGKNGNRWCPPPDLAGWNIIDFIIHSDGGHTTTNLICQLRNVTQVADVCSTRPEIQPAETSSETGVQAVIDAAQDDITADDQYTVDVDAVGSGTPKGLVALIVVEKP